MRRATRLAIGGTAVGVLVAGLTTVALPASAATASYHSVTVFGNATNGTVGSLLSVATLDATGGDGPGGSGAVTVINASNDITYTATLDCVLQSTNAESQDVLHVTGTVDSGGPVTDRYFTLTLVATPILGGLDRVSNVGINHRNTKPYNCTVPAVINHNAVAGLLTVS
jgi:hypothetical protein